MIKINDVEILTVLDGVSWGGAKDSAVRTLDFSFLFNPLKKDIPEYKAKCGDEVKFIENGKTLFLGRIEKLNYSTDSDKISISCSDLISRLKRSKFIGRYTGTLNEIAGKICALFNLTNGINVSETAIHNIVSTGDKTYYDVLFEACSKMYKNFQLYMDGTMLKLAEHDSQATFEIGKNIRASSIEQDISNLINKVLIIDDNGNIIDKIEKTELIEEFGLYQDVYNYNKNVKNNMSEADKLTKLPKNKATIVCDNDNNCISGRFIKVIEPINGYMGLFEILTDSHTISSNSVMTLEIELVYETKETEEVEL